MIFLSCRIYLDIHSSNIYGNEYIRIFICPKNLCLSHTALHCTAPLPWCDSESDWSHSYLAELGMTPPGWGIDGEGIVKGMVHMNSMLVPIDVFVYWDYDKHWETSHTSLFKQINYFLRLTKIRYGSSKVPDQSSWGARSGISKVPDWPNKLPDWSREVPDESGKVPDRTSMVPDQSWEVPHLNTDWTPCSSDRALCLSDWAPC